MRGDQRTARARSLRRGQTDAEEKLWYDLRDRRFCSCKFRRQHPVGSYFADFACLERMLIVELDGSQHLGSRYDDRRSEWLRCNGWRVVRFLDNDVLANTAQVLQSILLNL
ncbi:MAG TPA: DUF559 domain-containing protein [Casimicrobiaceae bacterium]